MIEALDFVAKATQPVIAIFLFLIWTEQREQGRTLTKHGERLASLEARTQ